MKQKKQKCGCPLHGHYSSCYIKQLSKKRSKLDSSRKKGIKDIKSPQDKLSKPKPKLIPKNWVKRVEKMQYPQPHKSIRQAQDKEEWGKELYMLIGRFDSSTGYYVGMKQFDIQLLIHFISSLLAS